MARTPVVLTIAGSDSGGGAGIQADLKAFARCGVHGTTAITAITAQNTLGVSAIHTLPAEIILAQVRAVAQDIGVDAVKVGMLGTEQIALAVARALDELPSEVQVVVDPVMVSESGAALLEEGARRALVQEIVPSASVVTPNLHEARVLAGLEPQVRGALAADEDDEVLALARAVLALGPRAVLVTGVHRERAVDVFLEKGAAAVEIEGERRSAGASHGSGCTHSSVLAAQLALSASPLEAARTARAIAGEAVARGLRDVGAGAGPVDVIGLAQARDRE
ncbi:MAG TPA: bifunctional hydroxymethylpyrimidine kinase/phosphomethylpyrimidine kinase [Solirubrobacteraceae bacterium]|nr:bifunctional hydroxymethylpyrimidine kinase/phosphomethylpyrimidine kinase [Solirubrobacteraceae bacterium]